MSNAAGNGRNDRLIKEKIHDPYMARSKPREPTVCPECKVAFSGGRWQWLDDVPGDANEEICPACARIKDRVPAGFLTLKGDFFAQHREEIMNLIQNKADYENKQHPMNRIMDIEDQGEQTVITFTDMHLPKGVADAVNNAYKGDLKIDYLKDESMVRINWER
jgi:NMD protein affecting ribosome stability and mRNA decay